MKATKLKHANRMKVRHADARLNEILLTHKRNTATRRRLLKEFWEDIADAKLQVRHSK